MTRTSYYLFYISHLLVTATGLVYGWMRYFCTSDEPFAVVNHPLQPQMQHWHVLTSPLLVLMIGGFWYAHAMPRWRCKTPEGR
ncbi:MAG: hypothetical protein AAF492_12785, partial [Verrucomicrobiota bacterium]